MTRVRVTAREAAWGDTDAIEFQNLLSSFGPVTRVALVARTATTRSIDVDFGCVSHARRCMAVLAGLPDIHAECHVIPFQKNQKTNSISNSNPFTNTKTDTSIIGMNSPLISMENIMETTPISITNNPTISITNTPTNSFTNPPSFYYSPNTTTNSTPNTSIHYSPNTIPNSSPNTFIHYSPNTTTNTPPIYYPPHTPTPSSTKYSHARSTSDSSAFSVPSLSRGSPRLRKADSSSALKSIFNDNADDSPLRRSLFDNYSPRSSCSIDLYDDSVRASSPLVLYAQQQALSLSTIHQDSLNDRLNNSLSSNLNNPLNSTSNYLLNSNLNSRLNFSPIFNPSPSPSSSHLRDIAFSILARGVPDECFSGVDLHRIANGSEKRRTMMVRNIPNKFTQQMLIDKLNEVIFGQYDFLYLRMDFKNRCNVGYAFVNFSSSAAILLFADRFLGRTWGRFKSDKICGIAFAAIQGRDTLIQKFRNSSVMLEDPASQPKLFYTHGSLKGSQEPFPGPTTGFRPKVDVLFSRTGAWKQKEQ